MTFQLSRRTMLRAMGGIGVGLPVLDCMLDGNGEALANSSGLPQRYAIVFADVHMPLMDGFEMTAEIRRLETADGRPRTPIVAVTANAMAGDREICLAFDWYGWDIDNDLERLLSLGTANREP